MKTDAYFFEFIGLPGAGKTSVAQRVTQLLSARDHLVYTRENLRDHRAGQTLFRRGFALGMFLLRNSYLVMRILYFGLLFRPINFYSLKYAYGCVRTIFKVKTALTQARQTGRTFIIFDQGILQDLWSIGVTGIPLQHKRFSDLLFKLLQGINEIVNCSTVLFEIHVELAAQRILAREPSQYRFDNMDKKTLIDKLNSKASYLQLIVETVSQLNQHNQLVIHTNNASIETSAERVVTFISNIYAETVPSPS
jgi:thymidylate kinase